MNDGVKTRIDSLFDAFSVLANGAYTYVTHIESGITRWSKDAVSTMRYPFWRMERIPMLPISNQIGHDGPRRRWITLTCLMSICRMP